MRPSCPSCDFDQGHQEATQGDLGGKQRLEMYLLAAVLVVVKGECAVRECDLSLWLWAFSSTSSLESVQPPPDLAMAVRDSSGIHAVIAVLTRDGLALLCVMILGLWEMGYQGEKGLGIGELPDWNELEGELGAMNFAKGQAQGWRPRPDWISGRVSPTKPW